MAFDAGSIIAKLRLDDKKFTAGIIGAKKKVGGFSASLRKMSTLTKGLVAGSFVYATKKLVDFTSQGARLKDMEMAFDRLALRAGSSSDEIIAGVRGVTKTLSRR
jgi:hypothetical protein